MLVHSQLQKYEVNYVIPNEVRNLLQIIVDLRGSLTSFGMTDIYNT